MIFYSPDDIVWIRFISFDNICEMDYGRDIQKSSLREWGHDAFRKFVYSAQSTCTTNMSYHFRNDHSGPQE